MTQTAHFTSLDELLRVLHRERALLGALFKDRKKMSFRYDLARELSSHSDESLDFLNRYGVIRDCNGLVELSDVYMRFFEEVLEVNEEISVAGVKEHIDSLNANIDYYLSENNAERKRGYLRSVERTLQNIARVTRRNVVDLKRNIDNTYKNEPNFVVKRKKLVHLDEKRRHIASLISECERVIDEKQTTFFAVAMDVQLKYTVTDVKLQLREVYHNLLELDRQIINYLNLIEYQSRLLQKVHRLKYLRDQLLLDTGTSVCAVMAARNPVWLEPRRRYSLKVSLSVLRNSDVGLRALRDAASGRVKDRLRKGNLAAALTSDELLEQRQPVAVVDVGEVKNAFMASGDHLFHFVMNFSGYNKPMTTEDKLVVFCQIAAQYLDEQNVSGELRVCDDGTEYSVIYPKNSINDALH